MDISFVATMIFVMGTVFGGLGFMLCYILFSKNS